MYVCMAMMMTITGISFMGKLFHIYKNCVIYTRGYQLHFVHDKMQNSHIDRENVKKENGKLIKMKRQADVILR